MPSCAATNSTRSDSAGNNAPCTSGASWPSNDGPSNTPATISPTTCGCPMRLAASPTSRHAAKMTNIWRKKRTESWGALMVAKPIYYVCV